MKTWISILALCLLILSSPTVSAQWVQSSTGLDGCPVFGVLADGNNLFVGTGAGAYHSANNGSTWSPINSGYVSRQVNSFVGSSTELFSATANGFYVSTNAGSQWTKLPALSQGLGFLWADGPRIFAGLNAGGLQVTTDKGATWTNLTSAFPAALSVYDLKRRETEIFAATSKGIFRSADNGASWQELISGPPFTVVRSLTVNGNTLLAGLGSVSSGSSGSVGVYKSVFDGISWGAWMPTSGIPNTVAVNAMGANGNLLLAGTSKGLFQSTDDGDTWSLVAGLPEWLSVNTLVVSGDAIYAGANTGLFRSTGNGVSWTTLNNTLTCAQASGFVKHGTKILASTGHGSVFETLDDGTVWTRFTALDGYGVGRIVSTGTHLVASTGRGIVSSSDHGATWTNGTGLPSNITASLLAALGSQVYLVFADQFTQTYSLYKSTDGGATWLLISTALPQTTSASFMTLANGELFIEINGKIYKSIDNGVTWSLASNGLPPGLPTSSVAGLVFKGTTLFVSYSLGGVFKSTDQGANWIEVNNGIAGKSGGRLVATESNVFLVYPASAGAPITVYTTYNDGASWVATPSNIPLEHTNRALYIANNKIFGSFYGDKSVWTAALDDLVTGLSPARAGHCSDNAGLAAYPNPAADNLHIQLKDGVAASAIEIYDLTGRSVPVVWTKGAESLDISGYAPGNYVLKMADGKSVCFSRFMKR